MNWYYAEGQEQRGPFSDSEFASLVQAGTIKADTLVWRDGLVDWQPYAQATGAAPAAAGPRAGGIVCSECGQVFEPDNVIRYGDVWVCATCKPVFVQKLKEGAPVATTFEYAGFWIRFAAKFLDGLILGLPLMIVALLLMPLVVRGATPAAGLIFQVLLQLGFLVISAAYTIYFLGRYGATPGKMAVKIRVVTPDGGPISYGRATGRFFGDMLSGMICYIGYLMVAFDKEQRRALHDHICGTRVIKR